ncbi:murein hydrolase activator EnvC family protein [Legionella cardiaca]|uniref:Peptidoglycan DD-metalloendopeptidase family protein n=1 Tax=Legionella cardiaca TaxID=1071983 RepID=A0ABY8AV97_9GAMM|nr:peptidoglycan DD-metalloendopeptidase family protein [Legionella cardiaca]WED43435.1 peptidoglycan DD-metalloendopeptidase family protein [Legionella cardiaca]
MILHSKTFVFLLWRILLLIAFFTGQGNVWGENATIVQTKTKLRALDNQISKLKQTLANANDKRGLLNQELAGTEKQIGEGIRQLRIIQNDMDSKQHKIVTLQQNLNDLNKQLITQQQLLAAHVKTRYKMGQYEPLKWLINQDEPYAISRLLTFYQYLIQSRQHIIDKIDATKRDITLNQNSLKTEIAEQQQLQHELNNHQQQLERTKQYHTAVIQSLNNEIQTKQHTLEEYERNKDNLTRLLKTLAVQSIMQSSKPFTQMRRKLPRPVATNRQAFQKMNQGVTFFAAEGTPVTAVYPGKVVFSDWLNGYGLLLIIDHGQGFMTLYAHNQSLFKSKGSSVLKGEQIAAVGHSGGLKQNGLYFEVRHRGKAIPPLEWLS